MKNTNNNQNNYMNQNNKINNKINNNILTDDNIDYNKLGDKEILIRELLNSYRIKLNNELYEFIDSEEQKEKQRIYLYHNTSINKKEELKEQLAKERVDSTIRINEFIEENDKKYKEFEDELKKKYNLL